MQKRKHNKGDLKSSHRIETVSFLGVISTVGRPSVFVSDEPSTDFSLTITELILNCGLYFSGIWKEMCEEKQARVQLDLPHLKSM